MLFLAMNSGLGPNFIYCFIVVLFLKSNILNLLRKIDKMLCKASQFISFQTYKKTFKNSSAGMILYE